MTKFKKGDVVVMNNDVLPPKYIKGNRYVVSESSWGLYMRMSLEGEEGYWTSSNFDLAMHFKAGDHVRYKYDHNIKYVLSKPHEIANAWYYKDSACGWDHERTFELDPEFQPITPPAITAIVAELYNGQPRPNEKPHIHTSEASAKTEAERLSNKHRGTEFGVFVMKTVSLTPVAATVTRAA